MFWFEIHMTGDENIHEMAKKFSHKTIEVDLLDPNMDIMRTEHMTSIRKQYNGYEACLKETLEWAEYYEPIRTKIECPPIWIFAEQAIYIECHAPYDPDKNKGLRLTPISRNAKSRKMLDTDRSYDKTKWLEFYLLYSQYKHVEIELCLYDNNMYEDKDWMDLYENIQYRRS